MRRYRKVVEVDAVQFDPAASEWPAGVRQSGRRCTTRDDGEWCDIHDLPHMVAIYRLDVGIPDSNEVSIEPGWYVVTDWQGLRHAWRPEEFALTFQLVEYHSTPDSPSRQQLVEAVGKATDATMTQVFDIVDAVQELYRRHSTPSSTEAGATARLTRGRAFHDVVTACPDIWDELDDDGRESWCNDADAYHARLDAAMSAPDTTRTEPAASTEAP